MSATEARLLMVLGMFVVGLALVSVIAALVVQVVAAVAAWT